jgi:hypothetical protein
MTLALDSHYLHMGKAELKKKGITGFRLRLALALLHTVHDLIYLSVTMVFATTTLLYLLFEDFHVRNNYDTNNGISLSESRYKSIKSLVEVLSWTEFACLSFYLFDGACHIVSYGWIFLKQWDTVLEIIASIAAVIILLYNGLKL